MTHRVNSGKILVAALLAALCAMGAFLAFRVKAALGAKPAPPPPIQVRGTRIDQGPAPKPAPPGDGGPSLDTTERPPAQPWSPPGHNANKHGGTGPAVHRTADAEAEYPEVSFATLAGFMYVNPPKRVEGDTKPHNEQIPEEIRALDGKKVCVVGYMLPTDMDAESGAIKGFYLMRTMPQCCYGVQPQTNEWIDAVMAADAPSPDHHLTPLAIEGVIEVGEKEEEGWVVSVYRMRVHRVMYTE